MNEAEALTDNCWARVGEEVPDSTVLVRYIDSKRFLALLSQQSIWFTRLGSLLDVDWSEGRLPRQQQDVLGNFASDISVSARNWLFISCWCCRSTEDMAMWERYAPDGVAIFSSASRLRQLTTPSTSVLTQVRYLSGDQDIIPPGSIFNYASWKRSCFDMEREARLIVMRHNVPSNMTGIAIPCNLNDIATEIVFSPKLPAWLVDAWMDVIRRCGCSVSTRMSSLLPPSISS